MPAPFDDDTAASLMATPAYVDLVVSGDDTATRHRSGDLAVLATPRVVALVEEAACAALSSAIPAELTSVGTRVDLRHRAASAIGARVRASATVTAVDGARVQFDVSVVEDPDGRALLVADGTHSRVVIDRAGFLAALAERTG